MSPVDAIRREVTIALEAFERRLQAAGPKTMPERVTIVVELDRETGMPRSVDVGEAWTHRILRRPR